MNNNIIETGSSAKVILRAICDFSTNGKSYTKGQIVSYIPDCLYSFNFSTNSSSARQGSKIDLSYDETYANTITLSNVPMTTDLLRLLTTNFKQQAYVPIIEQVIINNHKFYTTQLPIATKDCQEIDSGMVFTYTSGYEYAAPDSDNGLITIVYYTSKQGASYDINSNVNTNIPYLSMEIINTGNINKQSNHMILNFNTVKLHATPQLSNYKDTITYYTLSCSIINTSSSEVVVCLEE